MQNNKYGGMPNGQQTHMNWNQQPGMHYSKPAPKQQLQQVPGGEAVNDAEEEDDNNMYKEENVCIKCPYTQQVMKEPMRNKLCGHSYEKEAIEEYMSRMSLDAKCPVIGCTNTLNAQDVEVNSQLKVKIQKKEQK